MAHSLHQFTNKYQLSKTLRFALIPQGNTSENIEKHGLLKEDFERAEKYKLVKEIIDDYHKFFIDKALQDFRLDKIEAFSNLYFKLNKTDREKEELTSLQADLRKQVASRFTSHKSFPNLFKKELIRDTLTEWNHLDGEQQNLLADFRDFTTYFTGFHENRKNMYSDESKATAIGFRLIHENLPKFLSNCKLYEKIKQAHDLNLTDIEEGLEPILSGSTLDEVFSINFFNETLTQNGITKYNTIIGGLTGETDEERIIGLNNNLNLYRQQKGLSKRDLPNFTQLFKQILSDREAISWLPESFENDNEVLDSINDFFQNEIIEVKIESNEVINVIKEIKQLLSQLQAYELSQIYIRNDRAITDISQAIFSDFGLIKNALDEFYTNEVNPLLAQKRVTKKYDEAKQKWLTKTNYFSLDEIETAIKSYLRNNSELQINIPDHPICDYFGKMTQKDISLIDQLNESYEELKPILEIRYPEDKNLTQNKMQVTLIKNFLDSLKQIQYFIKPLHLKDAELTRDDTFYKDYDLLYRQLDKLSLLYDKTRNYLTRKPYSTEKVKLNFQNSTLLDGWDRNKEEDNTSILLRKDGQYYLVIMNKKHNKVFREIPTDLENEYFEKINYKLLPGVNKMLPKVFFSKSRIDEFKPSDELLKNYRKGTHKKGTNFDLKHCHQLIDFFKASLAKHPEWKNFGFEFSETATYDDLSGFYREVQNQGYKIDFQAIPVSFINKLVDEEKIYLFQIYNKDFSPHSTGRKNLHTMYWEELFSPENLKDTVLKLNGQAEVFFRKKSITKENAIHRGKVKIARKTYELEDGTLETVPAETVKRLNSFYNNSGEEHELQKQDRKYLENYSVFEHDIIKNKRYTVDHFQFHVPITLNFKAAGRDYLNEEVLYYLQNNPDVNIIGIDRGERHLLYVTVINQKGNILNGMQYSLNEIINESRGKKLKTNYHELLQAKETGREDARKSWGVIENIKELKEGYISQVVHHIAKLMVKHNAIVIMEDLNFGFKRGRQKVEKQVYQKFEKMLIDKLNYLVFKEESADKPGGVLKALQLTNRFISFDKMGKQNGFLFYLPAWNTSKIDPTTGFVNLLRPKYETKEKAKAFFEKFDLIKKEEDSYVFEFQYTAFTSAADGARENWSVYANSETRYHWNKNKPGTNGKGGQEAINVFKKMTQLFESYGISVTENENLKSKILAVDEASFFKELMFLFRTTIALRHNNGEAGQLEEDFILSSVKSDNGTFFDSREVIKLPEDQRTMPQNADANGAYHIAMKGLLLLKRLHKTEDISKLDQRISNKDWLRFMQLEHHGKLPADIVPK